MNKKLVVVIDKLGTEIDLGESLLQTCREKATKLDVVVHEGKLSELVEDIDTKIVFVPDSYDDIDDIKILRNTRKDIFVVVYHETSFWQRSEQYIHTII
jgi:hypothetical protein